jgi:hypothetical protein
MKATKTKPLSSPTGDPPTFITRGQLAEKAMAKELRAEHKRWKLLLLSWGALKDRRNQAMSTR